MGTFNPKDYEDRDEFWSENVGLPYDTKYRPIYKKYNKLKYQQSDLQKVTLASGASLVTFMENKDIYDFIAIYEELLGDVEYKVKGCLENKNLLDFIEVYDEMMINVKQKIAEMFETFNIPLVYVDEAAKALGTHSQRKMFDQELINTVDEREWIKADEILEELNLPFRISMEKDEFMNLIKSQTSF